MRMQNAECRNNLDYDVYFRRKTAGICGRLEYHGRTEFAPTLKEYTDNRKIYAPDL